MADDVQFHEEKQAYYAAQRMKANGEAEAAASKVDEVSHVLMHFMNRSGHLTPVWRVPLVWQEADANNAATFGDDAVGAQEQPGTTAALEVSIQPLQAAYSTSYLIARRHTVHRMDTADHILP